MQWGTMGLSSKQSSSEWRDTWVQVRNGWVGGLWQGLGRKTGKAQRGGGVTQRDAGWKWCRCPGPWAVWRVLLRLQGSCGMWVRTVSLRLTLGVLGVQVFGRKQWGRGQVARQHATELASVTIRGKHVSWLAGWLAGGGRRRDCGTAKGNHPGERAPLGRAVAMLNWRGDELNERGGEQGASSSQLLRSHIDRACLHGGNWPQNPPKRACCQRAS